MSYNQDDPVGQKNAGGATVKGAQAEAGAHIVADTWRAAARAIPDPSLLKRFLRIEEPGQKKVLLACLIGGTLAIFALDISLPQELAPEMLYATMVVGSLWMRQPRLTLGLAALCSLFILLADIPHVSGIVLVNHGLSILLVWVIALLVVGVHGFLTEIQDQAAVLEQRVRERTADLSNALLKVAFQSEQLRNLASELTLVEQRERMRLAEQIHDGLQQLLVAAKLEVGLLGRMEGPTVQRRCQEVGRLLVEALADARSLTAELSPPILRTGGLLAGLEWLARWCQEKHHLTVQITAPATPLPPLPEDLTVLLFQSVRELLFNAVKYAQVPEATVTLVWEPPGLTLTVADAGAGFDPHGLRGEGGGGGGFGLARIRHRLELLGGCMSLGSAPGKGTRVTLAVLVPTAEQPATPRLDTELMASPQPALASAPGSPRPIRILLVDDHRVVRQALAQLLRAEADLEVVGEAGTGTAAVALARQLTPEVVLMDINMPEMNGIEATRTIHAAFPAMRVIGLSMHDRGDQQAAMQAAGAVAYVSKSGPAEALLAAIRGER
jgi:signal transduction histidine kinase